MLIELTICACTLVVGADAKTSAEERKEAPAQEKAAAAKKQEPKPEVAQDTRVKLIAVEKQILAATNAQRSRYGLPPLAVDDRLMESARTHCAWMTNSETLQHTNLPVAENIAMGQQTTEDAVDAWMRSPGHRANMLNGAYRRIGVAAYRTPRNVIFWCQQFRN